MDKVKSPVESLYDEFAAHGVVDHEDGYLDEPAKQQVLQASLDEFDVDIREAYGENADKQRSHMTHAALLRMALEGGDEAVLAFMVQRNMKPTITPAERRAKAIVAIPKTHLHAEKSRSHKLEQSEYMVTEQDARSLDETLWAIKDTGMLAAMNHGALRLLFGTIDIPEGANPRAIAQLKLNAIGTLRSLIDAFDLTENKRTREGKYIIQRFISRGREGYVTLESLATELAADSTLRRDIPYGRDITENRRMIETYISEAFDIIYQTDES